MIVKICGITNAQDALAALRAGADWIGLNLVAGPRRIEPTLAGDILSTLEDPKKAVALVRVERDTVADSLLVTLGKFGGVRLQLYGDVTPVAVASIAQAGFETIVVWHVADNASLGPLDSFLESCQDTPPDYILLDACVPGQLGGTGRRADWDAIAREMQKTSDSTRPPLLLAGGLTADNVAQAIARVSPVGVDVSSGVESSPGKKDSAKVKAFIAAARGADHPTSAPLHVP